MDAINTQVETEPEFHPKFDGFEFVSSVDVDAGCIWVGDPCYVLKDPNEKRPEDLGANWHDICDRFFKRSGYHEMQKLFREHQYAARDAIQETEEYKKRFAAYIESMKTKSEDPDAHQKIADEWFNWQHEQERAWLDANPFDPKKRVDLGYANFTHDLGHGGMGTMISTNYGDGSYPVYIKYGKNGRPSMVLIDFLANDCEYTEPVADADLYTVEKFKELVESESIIASDGTAYPSNGTHYDPDYELDIDQLEYSLDDDTTHIVWCNV